MKSNSGKRLLDVRVSGGAMALLLAIGLGAGTLAGCDALSGSTPQEHMEKAKAYQAQGDLRASVIELKNAVQKDPDFAEARWLLGNIYITLGESPSAVKELQRARALGMAETESRIPLLRALILNGEYKKVLDDLAQSPDEAESVELLVLAGQAHEALGDAVEAKAAYDKALLQAPDTTAAQLGLARLAWARRDPDEMTRQLDLALESSPENPDAWRLMGELRLSRGEAATAQQAFQRALDYSRYNEVPARLGLARALLAQNQLDAAQEHIDSVHRQLPNHALTNYLRGLTAYKRSDLDAAVGALREVLKTAPDHQQTLLLMGSIQYAQGHLEQAGNMLTRYTAAVPDHVDARKLLAMVLLKQERPKRAVEVLLPVAGKGASDAQYLTLLGSAYVRSGNPGKGSEYLQRAAELAPNVPALRTQLAISHLASGATQQAVTELESALRLDQDLVQADVLLILIRLRDKKYDEALVAAEKLAAQNPDNPIAYNLKGAAYLGRQDMAAARKEFEHALTVSPTYVPAALNLAKLDLQAGDADAARSRYKSVLKHDEHNVRALVGLAELENKAGRVEKSLGLLEEARRHDPGALQPRLILAQHYLRTGRADEALTIATEASKAHPANAAVLTVLGRAQLATGKAADAMTNFQTLVEHSPNTPGPYVQLAAAQAQAGMESEARASFQRALELSEDKYPEALLGLAGLEARAGNTQQALKLARKLQEQQPEAAGGYAAQGDILMATKRPEAAAKAYEAALQRSERTELALKLYSARKQSGDQSGADQGLTAWLDKHPEDMRARVVLAGTHQTAHRKEDAIEQYEEVLKRDPNNPVALNNLAWVYHEMGDSRDLEMAERAHKAAPDSPAIMDTYGWLLVQAGKVERGLRLLRKAAEGLKGNPEVQYHLGAASARGGDNRAARKHLEAALASSQDFSARADAKALLDTVQPEQE